MKRHAIRLAVGLLLALTGCEPGGGFLVRPVPAEQKLQETTVQSAGLFTAAKIAVIDVDGLIHNARDEGMFSHRENPVAAFVEKVDKAQADPDVKAIVLRINSPGGGVTASDIMYRRLEALRQKRPMPVVAIIEDVGASGAYYLANGADTILAHPTSLTGSIGVIVQTISFSGSMKMLGIDAKALTSGPRKEMGSPLKPLDKEDQAILQTVVDQFYARFVAVVVAGRQRAGKSELTEPKVKALADGRIYTAEQAKANGLIDAIGYLNDAVDLAKEKAKVKQARVVMYHRPLGYRANVYSLEPMSPAGRSGVSISLPDPTESAAPRFLYLWTGGR
ncbi:MAG: signal peptide peptidase SppA [Planctomycetota bacterium]|nr:signal peptide peptidase SppA [Planctomycetota bacterium]